MFRRIRHPRVVLAEIAVGALAFLMLQASPVAAGSIPTIHFDTSTVSMTGIELR